MKIGISVPNNWGVPDPQAVVDIGVLADKLRFDSLWIAEHMFNTGYLAERINDGPYYHALATLAYLAARTSKIALGTSVIVLPFRHPVDLAKYAATVDQFSGGRVILGVGVGGLVDEFAALGLPFEQRGPMSDEALRMIKTLWTQPKASHHGAYWHFDDMTLTPRPVQTPHIPLWIGGGSKAAIKRTGLYGDGWHPTGIGIAEFVAGCAQARAIAEEAGRDGDALAMSMRVNVELGRTLTTEVENRSVIPGQGQAMIDAIGRWRDAGTDHLVLALNSSDIPLLKEKMHAIAEDILPAFRD